MLFLLFSSRILTFLFHLSFIITFHSETTTHTHTSHNRTRQKIKSFSWQVFKPKVESTAGEDSYFQKLWSRRVTDNLQNIRYLILLQSVLSSER